MIPNVKTVEQYLEYAPPVDVYASLRLLLRHVPQQYLAGLRKISLTNRYSLLKTYRGEFWADKERIRPADCRGLYHKGHIILIMDHVFLDCPEFFLLLPPVKTYLIAKDLYHEIGHHIHRIEEPGYRAEKETVADEWRDELLRVFLRHRYWYLGKLVRGCAALIRYTKRKKHVGEVESARDTA